MAQLASPDYLATLPPETRSPATESIVRKIVRLYVYTTLPVRKIIDILQWLYCDIELGNIVVDKELNAMLDREPRWLHPRTRTDMERRMAARPLRRFTRRMTANRLKNKAKSAAGGRMLGRKRVRRTKSDMSFDKETNHSGAESDGSDAISWDSALGKALSEYSDGFIRHVSRLLGRYSVKHSAASKSGSESESQSPSTEWARNKPLLAGQLLLVDVHRQHFGTCIEGGYAHDNNSCICATALEDSEAWYWAMPTGLTERGRRVLRDNLEQMDVEFSDAFGNTVLHFLGARAGPAQLVSALRAGADPSRLNNAGQTFLHMLGHAWFTETTKVFHLLQYIRSTGCEGCLTQRDVYGRTCFHTFFEKLGDKLMTSLAETFGETSRLRLRDAFGSSPIKASTVSQHYAGEVQLKVHPISKAEDESSSAFEEQAKLLHFIHDCVANPDKDFDGRNGLHCAAMAILSDTTLAPTPQGDYAEQPNRSRRRAMQEDSSTDRLKLRERITRNLITSGVDVNGYDLEGDTVLMAFAVHLPEDDDYKVPVSILQVLIDSGADVSARNRRGETALHLAARHGRKLAVRTLCQNGANPSVRDHHGRSVLQVLADCLEKCDSEKARAHYEACYAWLSGQGHAVLEPTTVQEWGEWVTASARGTDAKASTSKAATSIVRTRFQTELDELLRNVLSKDTPTGNDEDAHADPERHQGPRSPQSGQFQRTADTKCSIRGSSSAAGASTAPSGAPGVFGKHWSGPVDRSIPTPRYPSLSQNKARLIDLEYSSDGASTPCIGVGSQSTATQEICNAVLTAAFATTLDQLDAPEEAWESVYRCLAELSHIIGHGEYPASYNGTVEHTSSGNSPHGAGQSQQGSGKRKRANVPGGDGSGSGDDDTMEGDGRGGVVSGKSPPGTKKVKANTGFSCPFRKRNPLRFNVRSHLNCSIQPFKSITLLKRHVLTFHKRPLQMQRVICGRCRQGFGTQGELDTHLRVKDLNEMCPLKEAEVVDTSDDVEDGIGLEASNRLRDRTARRQILDWPSLWAVLFPRDVVIPDSEFNPVIELDEVKNIFEKQSVAFRALIYDKFRMASDGHDNTVVVGTLAVIAGDMVKQYFTQVVQECQTTFGSFTNPQRHEIPRCHPQPRLPAPRSALYSSPVLPSDTENSNTLYAPAGLSVANSPNPKTLASRSISTPPIVNSQESTPFVLVKAVGNDNPTSPNNIVRETEALGGGHSADDLPSGDPADPNPCPRCLQPFLGTCPCLGDWNIFMDFDGFL